jgi:NAD(P)-dependent dehydrogenase (short-subunit alcohol dehydrogenase family)
MSVNLKAAFMLTQIVGRKMIAQKSGKIINLASQAGEVGEAFKAKIPVGRFAYPEEIAAAALSLAKIS